MKILPKPELSWVKNRHYSSLDGLRGLAIGIVLIHHFGFISKLYGKLSILKEGWVGVDLFFVLSGFLITGILLDSKTNPDFFKNFYARRILRIFPLYYFYLILVLVLTPLIFPNFVRGLDEYVSNQIWFWFYIPNWLYTFHHLPKVLTVAGFLWSVAIEEQFYIIWPLFVYFLPKKALLSVTTLLIIFAILFRNFAHYFYSGFIPDYGYFATFARMDALLIGSFIAMGYRYFPEILSKLAPYLLPITFIAILIIRYTHRFEYYRGLLAFATNTDILFACLLIYAISEKDNLWQRFLNTKFMNFLGIYSYGLYMYNALILQLFYDKMVPLFSNYSPKIRMIAEFFSIQLGMAVTVVVALISYRYLETPFLKLKKYFVSKKPAPISIEPAI